MTPEILVAADREAASAAAAQRFVALAAEAMRTRRRFTVALAGGSTPQSLYARLADDPGLRHAVQWDAVHFFWGDERHVPPNDAQSNFKMAYDAMLSKLHVGAQQVHRIRGELADAAAAASDYEQTLRAFFDTPPGRVPRFDLVLLGLGADGHTASLFPGTAALQERERLVVGQRVEAVGADRITLTLPLLNNAAHVLFLVAGGDKAAALSAILRPLPGVLALPAQSIRPVDGTLTWIVDPAAAGALAGNY
jgi:6-phosphogluconolactonase